ncbi:MAG: hypothetical protein AAGG11_19895 [Pseudomonadota bacterium]
MSIPLWTSAYSHAADAAAAPENGDFPAAAILPQTASPGSSEAPSGVPCRTLLSLDQVNLISADIDPFRKNNLATLSREVRYRITELRIVRQDVFADPQTWVGRLANRLHARTRESAIRAALPFDPNATATRNELEETERILRRKPFFYDAVMLPTELCGDGLKLVLLVRDVWTLNPSLGASRSGGDNKVNVGLSDVNLLGSGKALSLEYKSDRDRSGIALEFRDPNVLNSRWTSRLTAADNDDGELYVLDLARPFFSLDSRWATGLRLERFVREKDLEFLGEDLFTLNAETNLADVFVASSSGRRNGWIDRRYLGYRIFREAIDFPSGFPLEPEDADPQRRRYSYPYLRWSRQQDRFVKRANIRRVGITEDLQLGWQFDGEVGWAAGWTGSDDEALLARARISHQQFLSPRQLLRFDFSFDGRLNLDQNRSEAVRTLFDASYLLRTAERWRFFARARYVQTRNLLPDDQLTLGGEDGGLRGYPSRYQPGDRSYLLTVEQRYYSKLTLFRLIRIGFAAFADVGQAWFHDEPPPWVPTRDGDAFDTLANVGLGLRLESIRTRRDRILHIDVARPLTEGPGTDDYEITITAKRSF